MGVKSTGDLRRLRGQILEAGKELKQRMLTAAATAVQAKIQMGFRTSTDPEGRPWAPLKVRVGKPLRDTGRLANSFTGRATENGITVGTNVDDRIVTTHQEGRTIRPIRAKALRFMKGARGRGGVVFARKVVVPARPMVPADGTLPDSWIEAADAAAGKVLAKFFKK